MGATATTAGSQGRLLPERAPDESDLRGKELSGEHRAGSVYITHKETITQNWLILSWL